MFVITLWLLLSFFEIILCFDCNQSCSCLSSCNVCRNDQVTTICLKDSSYYNMGYMYGATLKNELNETLTILKEFYNKENVSYDKVVAQAELFFERYKSIFFRDFLHGMAKGSSLTMDDCKVLNGMETLGVINSSTTDQTLRLGCAFANVPPALSATGSSIIARNYDYGPPFGTIAGKNVIATIIADQERLPVVVVGMPGQIYCPTCINSENIFVELNNGFASGGDTVVQNRTTLLLELLENLQISATLQEMSSSLSEIESDYSLIINLADATRPQSFEFSSISGMKPYTPSDNQTFVSTNFFLNQTWNLPPPKDAGTSIGVTRRNNLINLLDCRNNCDLNYVKNSMDVNLKDGGALWVLTIYQIVYDTSSQELFIRAPHYNFNWTSIALKNYFLDAKINSNKITNYAVNFTFFASIVVFIMFSFELMVNVSDYWHKY